MLICIYTHKHLKYFEVSVTIVVCGMDMDITILVNLRNLIEEHCILGLYSMENGGGGVDS